MLTRIAWENPPAVPFTAAALVGDTAILAAAEEILVVRRTGLPAEMRAEKIVRLPFVPAKVALSPSGRFLLARDRVRLEVWDVKGACRVQEVWAKEPRRSAIMGGFAEEGGREYLIWNDRDSDLHGYDLDGRSSAFSTHAETFRFHSPSPLAIGRHLLMIGFFSGETKESLTVVPLAQLLSKPESINDHFQHKRGIQDYAYRLCAGPAGQDSLVIFRDPQDDEDEPVDEDDVNRDYNDVWGLRGIYIRRVDGTLIERIPWDGPVESFAPISASPERILIACSDGIRVLSHVGQELPSPIAARWLATSPDGAEVLVQTSDGALALL